MRSIAMFVLFLVVLAPGALAVAGDWSDVERDAAAANLHAHADAERTRAAILRERSNMTAEHDAMKRDVGQKRLRFDALQKEYEALLERERDLNEELAAQAHEIKTIDGAIRTFAKQAGELFQESLSTPEHPERGGAIAGILTPETFPGFAGIKNLIGLYFGEMRASGEVVVREGDFVGADGALARGDILRIGSFTAAYRLPDGTTGYLRPASGSPGLATVKGEPGWSLSSKITAFFDGKSDFFPVDISNGAALARMEQEQRSLIDQLRAGGFLVWPIVLVGAVSLCIVIERFWTLGRIRGNSDRNMRRILEMLASGEWERCRAFCREKSNYPTCRIISRTLDHVHDGREVVENAFQEGLLKEMPMLERFLPTLSVLAATAPLLGLLGTVTGMIGTFRVITLFGTGDPGMMSGGISEALVTTQAGLAVAVPVMLCHHVLERRVDKIVDDIEEKGAGLAVALMKTGAMSHTPESA